MQRTDLTIGPGIELIRRACASTAVRVQLPINTIDITSIAVAPRPKLGSANTLARRFVQIAVSARKNARIASGSALLYCEVLSEGSRVTRRIP